MNDVTVLITTIPGREQLCVRALYSALGQFTKPDHIIISVDNEKMGAWHNRQKGLDLVRTKFVAFLDDDDQLHQHHLKRCLKAQADTGADVVIPWYDVVGGEDPVPNHRGLQVGATMHSFGITCLVNVETVRRIGARFTPPEQRSTPEDFNFWGQLLTGGARFHAIPDTTWIWHHHHFNTSGLPDRW